MTVKKNENETIIKKILESVDKLDKLMNERIAELHYLAGTKREQLLQGTRHNFCYYRDIIWTIRNLTRKLKP